MFVSTYAGAVAGIDAVKVTVEVNLTGGGLGLYLVGLPDNAVKESEAEAYCAVWDIMVELEKNLPMAFVFYGQDTLNKQGMRYDELGIFLPDSLLMKNLERHVAKAEAIIYAEK